MQVCTLGGHDQGYLAAGDHAHADLDRLLGVKAGHTGTQAAANQLGQHGYYGQDHSEEDNVRGHAFQLHLQTHAGKEDGGEIQEGDRLEGVVHVQAVLGRHGVGDHEACHESPGDIGDTEEILCNEGVEQAEHKGQDDVFGTVLLAAVGPPAEELGKGQTGNNGEGKEEDDLDQDPSDIYVGDREAGDNGEGDDAQHIVNDGGTQNGGAHRASEFAHLPEGLYGDTDRGGSEDDAQENIFNGKGIREEVRAHEIAACQGDHHTGYRNDSGCFAAALELVNVGFQASDEHQQDDAQAGSGLQEGRFHHKMQNGRTQEQAGDQRANHLRHMEPLEKEP